jgi:hypothetical protein
MMGDLRNPDPSRPSMQAILMIVGTLVALYVIMRWPQLSAAGPVHDIMVALGLQ